MSVKETVKRYVFFAVGLFINAFGISFITKAGLGTSPISSVPYVLSLRFPLSLGGFTFIFNMLLLLAQYLMLRKRFQIVQLLQIPIIAVFSAFIDMTMMILADFSPEAYPMKLLSLIIGCAILGFGVAMEFFADVVMLSGEATVKAISIVTGKNFGTLKICFDMSMVLCAVILSFIFFGGFNGVREGTILSSVLVGSFSKLYIKKFGGITAIFGDKTKKTLDKSEKV